VKVLLEMRPAFDGHAGIPQETRLLFRGLCLIDDVEIQGLMQTSGRVLAKGLPAKIPAGGYRMREDQRINRLSRVVISIQQDVSRMLLRRLSIKLNYWAAPTKMVVSYFAGGSLELTRFESDHFRDFVWRTLFAKTLPFDDFEIVTKANFRVLDVPYVAQHIVALTSRDLGHAVYPRLDTRDFDVMITQTPYPGTVAKNTKMVVRYHDAIPVLMPHTISDKVFHQATHFRALERNVKSGAYFACVSEATRKDLISIFPEAEPRAVTIHNMVSHHYYAEESSPIRIPEIIRTRLHSGVQTKQGGRGDSLGKPEIEKRAKQIDYLLMVSTIEPRKNHLTFLAAWEQLRVERFPKLKLVTVGMLGWDHETITKKFRPWQERGELFMLEDVPAPELRLLYKHARATVCPSFGEGFDFSGLEAMRCGGAVAASDIGVHKEVYEDAAEYFTPYSAVDIAAAIARVVDPEQPARRNELIERGAEISARYTPEKILPKWEVFLKSLV
jgi:glycosyltransferase involved in cell wall biosynthesis